MNSRMGPEDQALLESLITPTTSDNRVGLRIKFLSDVVAKPQKYLWEPYIPSDQLIGLYGPSHTAKSVIALDWAARITTAAKWPDGSLSTMPPRKVLMLAAGEDAIETVLKPRFALAGGDHSRMGWIESVGRFTDEGDIFEDMAALDQDIPEIEAALAKGGEFGMVIIDPVTNHLGSKRPNQEEEVRPVLMSAELNGDRPSAKSSSRARLNVPFRSFIGNVPLH